MRQETTATKRRRSYDYYHDDSSSSVVVNSSVHDQRRRQQEQLQPLRNILTAFLVVLTINIKTTLGFNGFVSPTSKKTLGEAVSSTRRRITSPRTPLCFEMNNKQTNKGLGRHYGTLSKKSAHDYCLFMTSSSESSSSAAAEKVTTTTTAEQVKESNTMSISEASSILSQFDQNQATFAKEENIGMGGGVSASMYVYGLSEEDLQQIRQATLTLAEEANLQRSKDQTHGRIMLGICADDCQEGLTTLKSWVTTLQLPRGLLHGMDQDGIPLDPSELDSVYIKYNSGGVMTFSEMRRSGLGFDSIWKPGDALLEPYDGDFRGVYFSVELTDQEFRQYGVLPLDLFLK